MLLKNSSALNPKLSPLPCISRTSSSLSNLHKLSSSPMFKIAFSHFRLTLPHIRKPRENCFNITDIYYEEMLEANPGNALLLRNYAKFLHEVKRDIDKAEKFYARAVLASPADGEVLSLYAELVWEAHKDVDTAEAYFKQAVQAAPHDCYVIASYANFLWNLEESDG
ncbi:hypothetical protein SUGI_1034200 [Cryptomeria japonica]|uniref:uncharacterized protein LOC131049748 n=1 Tax=Cryptomeria japonica TaxID=3369 RepID=UPI002414B603|nr:uncharacterized protein LOC131049748 [Cryptomeria japonica]GLJ49024.1 hypothetical protein SUGI_1034200 [Cryptomeria japonica]